MRVVLRNVCKDIKGARVLDNVNLELESGMVYGFKGKNGSGKTMLMRAISGLIKVKGEIEIDGKILGKDFTFPPSIGILIENPSFVAEYTGLKNLEMLACIKNKIEIEDIRHAMEQVGLDPDDKRTYKKYSLGMKQRLAIALSVMHDPAVLILDEPINGLDPIGIAEVRSFIRELCDARGKTILISSHILSEISLLADDIGIIDHGKLLEEESLAELEQKNRHYIHFTVSDSKQAAQLLETVFQTRTFKIEDKNNIQLMEMNLPIASITRCFVENGLEVSEAHLCEDMLEDYFKKVTGGEGIA